MQNMIMEGVKEFSEDEFSESIKQGNWVIDFWAPWCGPCKLMAPHIADAASKTDKAKFGKIDVQKYSALGPKFEIRSIPCLIYFQDGKEVHRTVGLIKADQILDNVKEAFE
jgi:thioredoxin 2